MNVTWHLKINGVSASIEAEPVLGFRVWEDGSGLVEMLCRSPWVCLYVSVDKLDRPFLERVNAALTEWLKDFQNEVSVHLTITPEGTRATLKAKTVFCTVEKRI